MHLHNFVISHNCKDHDFNIDLEFENLKKKTLATTNNVLYDETIPDFEEGSEFTDSIGHVFRELLVEKITNHNLACPIHNEI